MQEFGEKESSNAVTWGVAKSVSSFLSALQMLKSIMVNLPFPSMLFAQKTCTYMYCLIITKHTKSKSRMQIIGTQWKKDNINMFWEK